MKITKIIYQYYSIIHAMWVNVQSDNEMRKYKSYGYTVRVKYI